MTDHLNHFIDDKFSIDKMLELSWHFKNSREFEKFFRFIARFDHYSRYNSMLVYIQNPAVTFFGGLSFWKKKFNRTIKEEAKPHIILAPKGPIMLVYDVFDTEGFESPEEFLKRGLGRKPLDITGYIKRESFESLIAEVRKWGIAVSYKPFSYFQGGYVTTIQKGHLEICLKKDETNEYNLSVLLHELGHLFLGHTGFRELHKEGKKNPLTLPVRRLTNSVREIEAETVNYLLLTKLGLKGSSIEYIASHMKEEDLLQFEYEIVIKTADLIERMFLKDVKMGNFF